MNNATWLSFLAALLCASATAQEPSAKAPDKSRVVKVATLGATTRVPTKDEVEKLGLKTEKCVRGQVVVDVAKDGAAAKSGLTAGDAIVKLDKVDVFSQDDIADILRASLPKKEAEVVVVRAGSTKEEALRIEFGTQDAVAPESPPLAWQFASLAHLDAALAKAKEDKKVVLVGLSGAET